MYVINGRTHQSLDEIPPALQALVQDDNHNGVPDLFEAEGSRRSGDPLSRPSRR